MLLRTVDLNVRAKELNWTLPNGWTVQGFIHPLKFLDALTELIEFEPYAYASEMQGYGKDWTFGNLQVSVLTEDTAPFASAWSKPIGFGSRDRCSYLPPDRTWFVDEMIKEACTKASKKLIALQGAAVHNGSTPRRRARTVRKTTKVGVKG